MEHLKVQVQVPWSWSRLQVQRQRVPVQVKSQTHSVAIISQAFDTRRWQCVQRTYFTV